MALAWDFESEVRWKRYVLKEAEIKNGRYPWNVNEMQRTCEEFDGFTNSRLSNRCLRVISSNVSIDHVLKKKTEKNLLETPSSFDLNSRNIDENEYRIRTVESNPRSLSVALDNFIKGVDTIEKELQTLKNSAKFSKKPWKKRSLHK